MQDRPENNDARHGDLKETAEGPAGWFRRLLALNTGKFITVFIFFLILVTGAMIWLMLSRIKAIERTDIRYILENTLQVTQESIYNWYLARKAYIETWTTSSQLLELTKALLKAPRSREALLADPAMAKVRHLFSDKLIRHGYLDFFIIAPDNFNVASLHEETQGQTNLIATHSQSLSKVFRGFFQLTHPMMASVALPDKSGIQVKPRPTMFACAPIKDETDKVIAALALQVDPDYDVSRITTIGRFGSTGDTYAFDRTGRLLTKCRFDDILYKIGLLNDGQESILNLDIRDPGGDMTRGFRPGAAQKPRPLTRMAQQATAGNTGIDLDGYRDYRGVPVVGAWTWLDELNVGLATEIERTEAYRSFFNTRLIVLVTLGIVVSMFLGFSIMLALNRRKVLQFARQLELKNEEIKQSHEKLEQRHLELKRTQAQLVHSEKMAGLGTLVAGVAHEINNPNNFVSACSQNLDEALQEFKSFVIKMLGENPDPETVQLFEEKFNPFFENLSAVRDGSRRIQQIVTLLQTFSRFEEADQKCDRIIPGLNSTIKLIETQYRNDVDIECDFQADLSIRCQPAQLHQVFMNMIINACQAITAKKEQLGNDFSGKLKISTAIQDQYLMIRFQDNGCGIPEEVQQKIFDPFFTTKDVGEGTGLGLSISYGIVENHKGRIQVESEIGQGTTFTIFLPPDMKLSDRIEAG